MSDVLAERLPWTLLLTASGVVVAIVVAGGLALWSVRSRTVARTAVAAGHTIAAVPPFLLVLVAVAVLAVHAAVLPAGGVSPPGRPAELTTVLRHLVLPAGVLAVTQVPWLLLHLRASLVAAFQSPHVRGARARGLRPATVLLRHALPTSLLPFVTTVGARLGELLTGVLVVEEMLAWPGVAGALVTAAVQVDFALLAALTVIASLAVMFGVLAADVAYLLIDPRVVADG